ncbi:hypothetical protein JCM14469_02420 [Desulfatiferula olefinivorans]
MGETNRRLKKNLFINKGLQFRIIMTSMMYMFLVMIVTTGSILFPLLYEMLTAGDLSAQYSAAQTFLLLAKRLMPATVILFTLFFIHQLYMTHRICGPLVNFTNTFRKITNGSVPMPVTLRKKDYLKQECAVINDMIHALSEHFNRLSDDHQTILTTLEQALETIQDPLARTRIGELLQTLKARSMGDPSSEETP